MYRLRIGGSPAGLVGTSSGRQHLSAQLIIPVVLRITGCVLFQRPDNRPGPGPGPAVLFRGPGRPGRPKVGPAVKCGRYRPRPPPALFVFCKWRRQAICKVK